MVAEKDKLEEALKQVFQECQTYKHCKTCDCIMTEKVDMENGDCFYCFNQKTLDMFSTFPCCDICLTDKTRNVNVYCKKSKHICDACENKIKIKEGIKKCPYCKQQLVVEKN